ncbi:hypothetical protein QFZ51_004210 [Chitinophaga sp. W3I9]|uniref:hypothetical protein n=1 Tax=Chitinophaga sp. W3I9 TaxID=3373924 RepID=UPI003D218812
MGQLRIGLGSCRPIPSANTDHFSHVHGRLQIIIDEKVVPALGYFGEGDVCLNAWLNVLGTVVRNFESGKDTEYTYDEGEQGQPAFRFVLVKPNEVAFSIVESAISGGGGSGSKKWRNKTFPLSDLKKEFQKVAEQFLKEVASKAPAQLPHWKKIIGNV